MTKMRSKDRIAGEAPSYMTAASITHIPDAGTRNDLFQQGLYVRYAQFLPVYA